MKDAQDELFQFSKLFQNFWLAALELVGWVSWKPTVRAVALALLNQIHIWITLSKSVSKISGKKGIFSEKQAGQGLNLPSIEVVPNLFDIPGRYYLVVSFAAWIRAFPLGQVGCLAAVPTGLWSIHGLLPQNLIHRLDQIRWGTVIKKQTLAKWAILWNAQYGHLSGSGAWARWKTAHWALCLLWVASSEKIDQLLNENYKSTICNT